MIRIAICNDRKNMLVNIEDIVRHEFLKYTDDFVIQCIDHRKFLDFNNSDTLFDVFFLDIDMIEETGFEIARKIRRTPYKCHIVFLTNRSELVYRSFEFQPFNFIKKINSEQLKQDIGLVVENLMRYMNQYVRLSLENSEEKLVIYYRDVVLAESSGHHIKFYIQNRMEPFCIRGNITDGEKKLAMYNFVRIHRRYLVNINYVKSIDNNIGKLYIKNYEQIKSIPVGDKYKSNVNMMFDYYLRGML